MEEKYIKRIIEELETMNCRLGDINYHLNEITTYGFINPELTTAIITIARSISKDYDKECKSMEE